MKRAILLQGPVGRFFDSLHKSLVAVGYEVIRINFNGGDRIFSRQSRTIEFTGSPAEWPQFFESLLGAVEPDFVAMFSDQRPVHVAALNISRGRGVPVWVFEEGYFRNDYITMELWGTNALSPISKDPATYADVASPTPPVTIHGRHFRAMAWSAVKYYVALTALKPLYYSYAHHRRRPIMPEAFFWVRNAVRRSINLRRDVQVVERLLDEYEKRYFVIGLQVHDDLQLSAHGRGWTCERLIIETTKSFAASSDPSHHLVFKVHPLDRGHKSYRPMISTLAKLHGIEARVHVIEDCAIGLLLRHSLGLVTINSTSGLLALRHGCPVLTMGNAFYSVPGLVVRGEEPGAMDRFWREINPPDAALTRAFMSRIVQECLVNGSFYLQSSHDLTMRNVLTKIETCTPSREQIGEAAAATYYEGNVRKFRRRWLLR